MGQIEDLEQRITAAFARISAGILSLPTAAAVAAAAPPPPEPNLPDPNLQEALDEERMANAQLNERLRVLSSQANTAQSAQSDQRAQIDSLTRQLDAQGLDVQRLTSTIGQLREDLRRLREAAEQGIVDPSLINRALQAELDALRTARAAEVTEMTDILSALSGTLTVEEARPHA